MRHTALHPLAFALIGVLAVLGGRAEAGLWDTLTDDVAWSGYIKNETAYRFDEPRSFTKIRNIFALNANYRFGNRYELTASGWAYHDMVYNLFSYEEIAARRVRDEIQPLTFLEALEAEQDTNVVDLREFYLDIYLDSMDIRLGRQFVVWGVLTGVRIVDEINPMDFRELILLDLLDYRIPLWMARFDYYWGDTSVQLLWIPDIRFHEPAPRGSEWELLQDVRTQEGDLLVTYPESSVRNSETAIKVAQRFGPAEVSLSYFYTWDDFPVIFREAPVTGAVNNPDPEFFPTYTRIHMYGMTFQSPLFGWVIKGEAAYVKDKYFGVGDLDEDGDGFIDDFGEVQRDHVRWGMGVDFNIFRTDVSLGVMQWIVLDYLPEMIQDEHDTSFNLFLRREFPERRTTFTLLGVFLYTLDEGYVKPKLVFDITDRFQVGVGLDLLWGNRSLTGVGTVDGRPTQIVELEQTYQFVGNFKDNDRIFMEFKYAF